MTAHPIDKASAIKLQVQKHVLGQFLGSYRSLFRGKGLDYDEIRKYVPGDDPKAFAWAKLAQCGEPYVKTFLEERDLSVIIALDTSGSVFWGRPEKATLALQAAAILIFSAAISRDKIGLALFSEDLERFAPPRRGMAQAGRLIEIISNISPGQRNTYLAKSLQAIGARRGPKRAVIIVISDFISHDQGWPGAFATLARRNDCIALQVIDQWERDPPNLGWLYATDAETKKPHLVRFDEAFHKENSLSLIERHRDLSRFSAEHDVGLIELNEGEDPIKVLKTYFDRRRLILERGGR